MKLENIYNNRFMVTKKWNSNTRKNKIFAISLVIPAFVMLCITIIVPVGEVIRMSFHDYSLLNMAQTPWNNFNNYITAVSDKQFWMSLLRSFYYVFVSVAIAFILGLIFALLLNQNIKGRNFFRGMLFLPWTMPQIIIGIVWMWMYQPDYGILNYILKSLHIVQDNVNWLSDMNTAMPAVIVATVWKQMPIMMVMILAGLQTVPMELVEAAIVDGANGIQRFLCVIMPCIMSVIKTVTLTQIINNFQMFGLFYTMTGGGPVNATKVLSVYTYETAFMNFNMGKGAAVGVIWLLFLITFATFYNKLLTKKEIYAD